MDNRQEHLDNLNEIRSLMERSSSFISLSGLSGISAGVIGVITTFILQSKIGSFMNNTNYFSGFLSDERRTDLIIYCVFLFSVVLGVTFAAAILFTYLKAKKYQLKVWDSSAKRLVLNLFFPLIIGGMFCLLLVYHYYDFAVMPAMLVFYGLALINAGKYTLNEIRWLGVSECVLGLAAFLFLSYSLWIWGIGFGLVNIIYGAVMYFRHERK